MKRVTLLHWKAEETPERMARLRKAGFEVHLFSDPTAVSLRALRSDPPDAFVIDLSRLPSHGRAVAIALRQSKSTREIPLVFVDGDPVKLARIKEVLPDAVYTDWKGVAAAVKAGRRSTTAPVVPQHGIASPSTPLSKKLSLKAGATLLLIGAPEDFERLLNPLPEGAQVMRNTRVRTERVMLFAASLRELETRFPVAERATGENGGLWIAWPKKSSGVDTDLDANFVRAYGMDRGWVDYKVCSIDATWSGHLFSRRKK